MGDRIDLTNNQGPLLNIAEWVTLTAAILAAGMKMYIKWTMVKHLDWNDLIVGVATSIAAGLCVTISQQVQNGLGRDANALSPSQLESFYLWSYLSSLCYILITFLAKIASLHFFLCLSHPGPCTWFIRSVIGAVLLWTGIALFVVSFQCSLPRTWDMLQGEAKCINLVGFWTVHGVVDILTQIPAAFFPVYLLYSLHTARRIKFIVMLSFSPNILTVPLIIFRLFYIHTVDQFSRNFTWWSYPFFLVTSLHANFAIIFACLPFAKPVIDSLAIGVIAHDIGFDLRGDQTSAGILGNKGNYGHWTGRSGGPASKAMYGWRKGSGLGNFTSVAAGSGSSKETDAPIQLKHTTGQGESGQRPGGNVNGIWKTRTTVVLHED